MHQKRYYYLIKVQYLGYRLHGWQRQPNLKTVEGLIKKTLKYVLPERKIKLLGSSRTDAMVSANDAAFELFLYDAPLVDINAFLDLFNVNLPPDIKATSIREVESSFNIIQHPKQKEYIYLFAFGAKNHPFCAPLMANFQEDLDLEMMQEGAKIFEGEHYFGNFCVDANTHTRVIRPVVTSSIQINTLYTANFFPEKSYVFTVKGGGFLRYQIRLMMGALVQLGKGEITIQYIKDSLEAGSSVQMNYIAPASGLILNKIDFK
ncbi:tRNA pseudouridine(38-40) synthase TruA [soil metagenome]